MSTLSPLPDYRVPFIDKRTGLMTREWFNWFQSIDEWARDVDGNPYVTSLIGGVLALADGVAAPAAIVGFAFTYVDVADGDMRERFGDGVTKLLTVDT